MALSANQYHFLWFFWIPPFHTDSHPCFRIGGPVAYIGGPASSVGGTGAPPFWVGGTGPPPISSMGLRVQIFTKFSKFPK